MQPRASRVAPGTCACMRARAQTRYAPRRPVPQRSRRRQTARRQRPAARRRRWAPWAKPSGRGGGARGRTSLLTDHAPQIRQRSGRGHASRAGARLRFTQCRQPSTLNVLVGMRRSTATMVRGASSSWQAHQLSRLKMAYLVSGNAPVCA